MTIIELAPGCNASAVFAELQRLGHAWRPANDLPRLVYLDGGCVEEVGRIRGVQACWAGRSGDAARLLHGRASVPPHDAPSCANRRVDLSTIAVRGCA